MSFIHVLLEVHCLHCISESDNDGPIPEYCKYGDKNPGYHCLENMCKYIGYTDAPYEIAYAGEKGEVPFNAQAGFGGDMEPENLGQEDILSLKKLWEGICRDKVNEAYEKYMKTTGFPTWESQQEK